MPRPFPFPKSKRLTLTAEFDRVRREGSKFRGSLISLAILHDDSTKGFKVGLITSRKVGSAVARNRVRRRLREIVRRHQGNVKAGVWFVVIASPGAAKATSCQLQAEWLRLAGRASILAA